MITWIADHLLWVVVAAIAIVATVTVTFYLFRRRYFDPGPRKGTAANPAQVRRDNPPDH